MKKVLTSLLAVAIIGTAFAQKKSDKKTEELFKTDLDSVSYSMGLAIGSSIKSAGIDKINDKLFVQALTESLAGKEGKFTTQQANQIIQKYMGALASKKGSVNTEIGKKWLADNAKKEGVITTASGLQYKVITNGEGATPTINDKVKVHYHGTLIDGKVFDSSVERKEPISFPVSGVIKGWTEALQLMKVGSKYMLYIPSDLAYGERGVQGIEPNSVLIFEVELLDIEREAPALTPAPNTIDAPKQ